MDAMIIFYIILLAAGFIALLIYLFCRYAKVYRTLSSGERQFVGYLWKWSRTYVIYDGIPFFFAERIGFIDQNMNVYLKKENNHYNYVEVNCGTVNATGDVTDSANASVGVCEGVGTGASRMTVTDAYGNEIGFAKTGFRKGDDVLIRAAAAGALYSLVGDSDKELRDDVRVGFKDLALPSALIYMLLFVPLALLGYDESIKRFLGSEISYFCYMMLAYAVLCWVLYFIKKCLTMRNQSMVHILGLVNRNVGVGGWNWTIIFFSALLALSSAFLTNYTMLPLFMVLCVGFLVNLRCFNGDWNVAEPCASWGTKWGKTNIPNSTPGAPAPGCVNVVFSWAPILEAKGISHNDEEVVISLTEADYLSGGSVRTSNPFALGLPTTIDELKAKALGVLKGTGAEEDRALLTIINSAYKLCQTYNLADYELYDLVLMFCQFNVNYVRDEESDSISRIEEYFRFPTETLYDKAGDSDCKSVLAYKILKKLGVNVELALVKSDGASEHNHVAVVLHQDSTSLVPIPRSYPQYSKGLIYCDTTGDAYAPGVVPHGVDVDSIIFVK